MILAGVGLHLAFRVGSDAELLAMRDRIRSHGVNVIGPIDHGMCRSIYFAGPDRMTLEVVRGAAGRVRTALSAHRHVFA